MRPMVTHQSFRFCFTSIFLGSFPSPFFLLFFSASLRTLAAAYPCSPATAEAFSYQAEAPAVASRGPASREPVNSSDSLSPGSEPCGGSAAATWDSTHAVAFPGPCLCVSPLGPILECRGRLRGSDWERGWCGRGLVREDSAQRVAETQQNQHQAGDRSLREQDDLRDRREWHEQSAKHGQEEREKGLQQHQVVETQGVSRRILPLGPGDVSGFGAEGQGMRMRLRAQGLQLSSLLSDPLSHPLHARALACSPPARRSLKDWAHAAPRQQQQHQQQPGPHQVASLQQHQPQQSRRLQPQTLNLSCSYLGGSQLPHQHSRQEASVLSTAGSHLGSRVAGRLGSSLVAGAASEGGPAGAESTSKGPEAVLEGRRGSGRGASGAAAAEAEAEALIDLEDGALAERVSSVSPTSGQEVLPLSQQQPRQPARQGGQQQEQRSQMDQAQRSAGVAAAAAAAAVAAVLPALRPEEWLARGTGARVVVRRPEVLISKLDAMRKAGKDKLQIIADFDRTLTRYKVNGERGMSSHALVEQDDPVFNAKREELFNHYYPIETDPTIPFDEKTRLMEQWWSLSHDLLLKGGLTLGMITRSVGKANTQLRPGALPFFQLLEEQDIPLLIFSAGLGDVIDEILRQRLHRSFQNVRIVSNRMEFDASGKLIGFPGRIIHVLNKNEHALEMAAPLHERPGGAAVVREPVGSCVAEIEKHTTALLLGDHMGDLGMSEGAKLDTQISIAFLNDDVDRQLDTYAEAWDIVILDDGPLDVASNVVRRIIQLPE